MSNENEETLVVNQKTLSQMKVAILQLESRNVNTKEYGNPDMVDRITRAIIDCANKTY